MTDLRRRMLEELQRRNFSETTIKTYLRVVEDFARYFGKRPDRLNEHDIRMIRFTNESDFGPISLKCMAF